LGQLLAKRKKSVPACGFLIQMWDISHSKSIACIVGDTIKIPAEGFPSGIFSYYISVG
jgi:hypothetical protein